MPPKLLDCKDTNPFYALQEQNDKYLKIVSESMCGSTKEESYKNYTKIISNVAKQVIIHKHII